MKSIGHASKLSENELSLGRLKFRLLESHVLCWNTQKYYVSTESAKAAYVIKKNVSETNRVWGDKYVSFFSTTDWVLIAAN